MSLVDLQVVINASSITNQVQSQYLQGVQAAQAQSMMRLQRDNDLKNDQVTEPLDKNLTSSVQDKKDNTKQWKREKFEEKKAREEASGPTYKKNEPVKLDPDHIIDIRA